MNLLPVAAEVVGCKFEGKVTFVFFQNGRTGATDVVVVDIVKPHE